MGFISPIMAATGKPPIVELVTINKHCWEITQTLKKTKKLYAKPIKSKNMFSSQYASSGIFSLTIFRLGLKEQGTYVLENMRTTPTAHLVLPVDGTYLETSTPHPWLFVS